MYGQLYTPKMGPFWVLQDGTPDPAFQGSYFGVKMAQGRNSWGSAFVYTCIGCTVYPYDVRTCKCV